MPRVAAAPLHHFLTQLCEHRGEARERRINVSAAEAGRAAHRRGMAVDGFHNWIIWFGIVGNSMGLGGIPGPIRTRQVAYAKAVLTQDARGVVGTLAALAIRDDFAVARQLVQALSQLIERNVR